MVGLRCILYYVFCHFKGIDGGRTPRYLKQGILDLERKINEGKNIIWKSYTKQFLKNWKINYEFVYKAYFMKIAGLLTSSSEG